MRHGLCTMCDQSPSHLSLDDSVARDRHVVIGCHQQALSNHLCAHSVISMWQVIFLQHLARAYIEQSKSTSVLPINHVILMPQCLWGFVNHDYCLNMAAGLGMAPRLILKPEMTITPPLHENREVILVMACDALLKTWPSGLSHDKNLDLWPRFLYTWVPRYMFLT